MFFSGKFFDCGKKRSYLLVGSLFLCVEAWKRSSSKGYLNLWVRFRAKEVFTPEK